VSSKKNILKFIIHYSLFIIHYSLFIIHYSLFIIHYSLFIKGSCLQAALAFSPGIYSLATLEKAFVLRYIYVAD